MTLGDERNCSPRRMVCEGVELMVFGGSLVLVGRLKTQYSGFWGLILVPELTKFN